MMVWHLYTLKGSLSLSNLSAWWPSLLSMIHPLACICSAGPRYLSPFHQ